jgi:tRNA(fMet)-specific endonuclease VapC
LRGSAIDRPDAKRSGESFAVAYLLDTNVLSEPLRLAPNPSVLGQLRAHAEELLTASPVWQELVFGAQRLPASRRRQRIEHYLEDVVRATLPILAYDTAAAEWHARERARLAEMGNPRPFVDGQIAAIAMTRDLVLVTANVVDFNAFSGLRVEDWRATVV